jgi:hypothetical protein
MIDSEVVLVKHMMKIQNNHNFSIKTSFLKCTNINKSI